MKARVKATEEIVSVKVVEIGCDYKGRQIFVYEDDKRRCFADNELDFDSPDNPDYWTRLEHTYAGMAMQEILRGCGDYYELTKLASCAHEHRAESIAEVSRIYAHALVEKMKEAKA